MIVARYTIRYRPDGDGFWYEVRDDLRRLVASAWRAGKKRYAQEEARCVVERDRRSRHVAYELGGVRLEQPAVPRSRTAPIPEPYRLPADVPDTIVVDVEEAQR